MAKIFKKIKELLEDDKITQEDYNALRYAPVARELLSQTTRGDHNVFTEGTIEEILAHAQKNMRRDLEEKLEKERQHHAEIQENLRNNANQQIQEEREARQKTEQELLKKQEEEDIKRTKILSNIDYKARTFSRHTKWFFLTITTIIYSILFIVTFIPDTLISNSLYLRYFMGIALIINFIDSILDKIFGIDLKFIGKRIEHAAYRHYKNKLIQDFTTNYHSLD